VVVIVSDTPDVESVLFGPDGVASGASPGCVVVDMSTISPDATRSFGARLAEGGVRLVDAPVSGGSEGAEHGTLTIMVGGAASDVDVVQPVLAAMGSKITHVGGLGAGQATKAVNQVIVGGFYLAVAEGMALGMASGLDMARVLEAIGAGACRSWVLENRARNMIDDHYPLGFRLALHLKDERIALDAARRAGVELPLSAMVAAVEERLVAAGFGDDDVSAVARAYPAL
jgi:3-hydroxyisobutyrate dehydrogenase